MLDHVLVLTDDVETTCAFYCDVLGFETAERPELPFPGAWLASSGRVCVHVAERTAYAQALDALGLAQPQGPLDHVAFRVDAEPAGIDAVRNELPGLRQLFVTDPNGLRIELQLVTDCG
jgi:catechol 2,3-dioxygenase-like lactoylglutathione lyase family enzyme